MSLRRDDFALVDGGPSGLLREAEEPSEAKARVACGGAPSGAPSISDLRSLYREVSRSWCELQEAMRGLAEALGPERFAEAIRMARGTEAEPIPVGAGRSGAPLPEVASGVGGLRESGDPAADLRRAVDGRHAVQAGVADRLDELLDRIRKRVPRETTHLLAEGASEEIGPAAP